MNIKNSSFFFLLITFLIGVNIPEQYSEAQTTPQMPPSPRSENNEMKDMKEMPEGIKKMKMEAADHNHEEHEHKSLDVSDASAIPTLEVKVTPDQVKGWNLEIITTNFTFTPENLNQGSNPNQGHAHLYINGQKVSRIYSNWHYIQELPEGENEIKVTLNTDNHEDLVYQGEMISDRVMIENKK